MYCTSCGKGIDTKEAYCPHCGAKNLAVEMSKSKKSGAVIGIILAVAAFCLLGLIGSVIVASKLLPKKEQAVVLGAVKDKSPDRAFDSSENETTPAAEAGMKIVADEKTDAHVLAAAEVVMLETLDVYAEGSREVWDMFLPEGMSEEALREKHPAYWEWEITSSKIIDRDNLGRVVVEVIFNEGRDDEFTQTNYVVLYNVSEDDFYLLRQTDCRSFQRRQDAIDSVTYDWNQSFEDMFVNQRINIVRHYTKAGESWVSELYEPGLM